MVTDTVGDLCVVRVCGIIRPDHAAVLDVLLVYRKWQYQHEIKVRRSLHLDMGDRLPGTLVIWHDL